MNDADLQILTRLVMRLIVDVGLNNISTSSAIQNYGLVSEQIRLFLRQSEDPKQNILFHVTVPNDPRVRPNTSDNSVLPIRKQIARIWYCYVYNQLNQSALQQVRDQTLANELKNLIKTDIIVHLDAPFSLFIEDVIPEQIWTKFVRDKLRFISLKETLLMWLEKTKESFWQEYSKMDKIKFFAYDHSIKIKNEMKKLSNYNLERSFTEIYSLIQYIKQKLSLNDPNPHSFYQDMRNLYDSTLAEFEIEYPRFDQNNVNPNQRVYYDSQGIIAGINGDHTDDQDEIIDFGRCGDKHKIRTFLYGIFGTCLNENNNFSNLNWNEGRTLDDNLWANMDRLGFTENILFESLQEPFGVQLSPIPSIIVGDAVNHPGYLEKPTIHRYTGHWTQCPLDEPVNIDKYKDIIVALLSYLFVPLELECIKKQIPINAIAISQIVAIENQLNIALDDIPIPQVRRQPQRFHDTTPLKNYMKNINNRFNDPGLTKKEIEDELLSIKNRIKNDFNVKLSAYRDKNYIQACETIIVADIVLYDSDNNIVGVNNVNPNGYVSLEDIYDQIKGNSLTYKFKNISQEKLSFLTGFHRTYIGMIERGERNISISNMAVFAKVFELNISELIDLKTINPNHSYKNYEIKSDK